MKYLQKIKTQEELLALVEKLKKEGKKIGFTNGCFDILHKGHIRYLWEAKEKVDILIVGLNSDESVRKIKGKDRPIQPQEDRAEILATLIPVDYVVIFDEDTPYELLKKLKPDVLIKGGDYKEKEIIGKDLLKETFTTSFYPNCSTTLLIKKIRNKRKRGIPLFPQGDAKEN